MRLQEQPERASAAPDRRSRSRQRSDELTEDGIRALQRTAGNRAVVRMLARAKDARHEAQTEFEPGRRSSVHEVLRTPGRPLAEPVRAQMESRLGADFSDVRVHTDSMARASAAEVGARAYTSGVHVVIGDGDDRHTLAHELTHVIQQRSGPVAGVDRGDGLRVSDPSDRFERAAEANASRALAGPVPHREPGADAPVALQRALAPARVVKRGDARLHNSTNDNGDPEVRRHYVPFRDSAFTGTVPQGEVLWLDSARTVNSGSRVYVWARYSPPGGPPVQGYVNEANVQVGRTLPGTNLHFLPIGAFHQLLSPEDNNPLPGGDRLDDVGVDYLDRTMTTLNDAETQTGLTVRDRESLIQQILNDTKQLLNEGDGPWGQAPNNLRQVRDRVNADRATLVQRGLITSRHRLTDVEYTGSDFHKGGQQVLFLYFTAPATDTAAEDQRKLVYKPSSLQVDAELYGRGRGLAATLDPTGERIPTYTIIPATTQGADAGYGYLEFVPSGSPRTDADLLGVYASIGANMALSYVVGLEDVHEENVLLLQNRIQVIDMEATTGIFGESESTGFEAQLWHKAVNNKIGPQLRRLATNGQLTDVPATDAALAAARQAFTDTLDRALGSRRTAVSDHGRNLAQQRARFVPIATATLQDFIFVAGSYDYQRWLARLNDERATPGQPSTLAQQALGSSGSTIADMDTILRSRAVFDALKRGDVPYFSRDLGSSDVYDEAGGKLAVNQHSKIGPAINDAITGRMAESSRAKADQIFAAQALPWIRAINNDLLAGGHGPGAHSVVVRGRDAS
ncbi:eCIS core domain-containing protein [Actinophytocola sediminis]